MKAHTKTIDTLVVHHSASPLTTTVADIRKWHLARDFDEVGYHFVITSHGLLEYTRPIHMQGAHARGHNNGTLGCCLIGNNNEPENRWRREQVFALQRLWTALRDALNLTEVTGHRDLASSTECPGVDVRPMLLGPREV